MKKKEYILTLGDRVYAMLSVNGRKIAEFTLDRVSDMTELIGEMRNCAQRYSGLVQVYVRNMTRGWSFTRPLMLYTDVYQRQLRVSASLPGRVAAVSYR